MTEELEKIKEKLQQVNKYDELDKGIYAYICLKQVLPFINSLEERIKKLENGR